MNARKPFVNRREQLADVGAFLQRPPAGPAGHIAIIAGRRMGKSELIKEFRRRHPKAFLPFIEVQTADLTAAGFVRELLRAYFAALARPTVLPLATSANVMAMTGNVPDALRRKLADVLDAADRAALPDHELRRAALRFGEELLAVLHKRGILFLDECESWFAPPGETPSEMERVVAEILNSSDRMRLVVTGSAQRVMEATFRESPALKGPRRPLYGRFRVLTLAEFSNRDTKELVDKLWRHRAYGAEAANRVFTLTRGHPGAAATVAEAVAAEVPARSEITPEMVERAFVDSLFEPLKVLNVLADADYKTAVSVGRAPKTMARVLQAIAELGPGLATATEISRRAPVKPPNVREILTPLLDSDLLRFDDARKTYSFSNALLPIWLRGRSAWVQSGGSGQPYAATLQIVREELERYRKEAAGGTEAIARDLASRFDGGPLPGALFGRPGTSILLPHVVKPVHALQTVDRTGAVFPKDTSVEIDLFIDAAEQWIGEVKTTGRVTAAAVKRLVDKAQVLRNERVADPKVLWFISSAGFDQKALDYARKNDVRVSRATDLRGIADLLKQPASSARRKRP